MRFAARACRQGGLRVRKFRGVPFAGRGMRSGYPGVGSGPGALIVLAHRLAMQ